MHTHRELLKAVKVGTLFPVSFTLEIWGEVVKDDTPSFCQAVTYQNYPGNDHQSSPMQVSKVFVASRLQAWEQHVGHEIAIYNHE